MVAHVVDVVEGVEEGLYVGFEFLLSFFGE